MFTKYKDSLLLTTAALVWGFAFIVQSTLSEYFGTNTIVGFKSFGGFLLFLLALLYKIKIDKKTIRNGIIIGIVYYVGLYFQQKGIENTSISKSSFIGSLYIICVPIISILFKKKPKKSIWLSVLLSMIGMYLLCNAENFYLGIGEIYALLGALLFSIQIILTGIMAKDAEPILLTAIMQMTLGILAFTVALFTENFPKENIIQLIPSIIYVAFISGAIAQIIQVSSQKKINPALASLIMSLESVFGTFFGWAILGQPLSIKELFGCILMFVAIIIAS